MTGMFCSRSSPSSRCTTCTCNGSPSNRFPTVNSRICSSRGRSRNLDPRQRHSGRTEAGAARRAAEVRHDPRRSRLGPGPDPVRRQIHRCHQSGCVRKHRSAMLQLGLVDVLLSHVEQQRRRVRFRLHVDEVDLRRARHGAPLRAHGALGTVDRHKDSGHCLLLPEVEPKA